MRETPEPALPLDLATRAREQPDTPAVIMGAGGQVQSYREIDERSNRLAALLRAEGFVAGDHIAILMGNGAAYLEVAWAAQRSGLYYTALNSHLRSAEVQYILDDCGATALVTTPAMVDVVSALDLSRVPVRLSVGGRLPGFTEYEEAVARFPEVPILDESEGREMLYSSGTTGRPKGVRKELPGTPMGDPSAAPVQIALALARRGAGQGSVYLSPAPLYHSAPLVYCMSMLRLGATVVVMEHFDPALCLQLIERHRVTHAQFVPTMFVRMLHLPESERGRYDISSLRSVVHAAAPCPIPVKHQMLEWWGPIIDEYYAGTEDIGSTWITAAEWLAHPGSVGRPLSPAHVVGPTVRSSDRARRESSTSREAGPSSITTTRRPPRRWSTTEDGGPWGTSACSTQTATCTSPTARRT